MKVYKTISCKRYYMNLKGPSFKERKHRPLPQDNVLPRSSIIRIYVKQRIKISYYNI